ncbi:hypothetical protein ABZ840_01560 [Streptomyces sp. NPDC047117]|uniref:hypothetical protein n=1 Tax=Streptomyces sp. NPDC047117 TaxID=3155379 RepID=UPI0033F22FD3
MSRHDRVSRTAARPPRRMRVRSAAVRLAVCAVLAACAMLSVPQEASACAVSYGYRPSMDINTLREHRTCSAGTSTAGVAGVAVLVLGALAAAGVAAFRSGERRMGAGERGRTGPHPALTAYLDATGMAPPERGQQHAP